MASDARDGEAAWRDLVAHYSAPDAEGGTPAPWPDRENLPGSSGPGKAGADVTGPAGPLAESPAEPPRESSAEPPRESSAEPPRESSAEPPAEAPPEPPRDPVPGIIPAPPRLRIIRPAIPAPLPETDDDEHFVPPAPPPLPRLDAVSKGAWLALLGGPAYLLLAVLLGWQVPGVAAFCAVAAFVGGFATLVARMGDRPPNDSGPDDGAVV